tara:strand:+ start:1797 stop:2498 length:702 start_codon:yes stop_codon:yes gene_type:complete
MIAAAILYGGAAVGLVEASGHGRPLQGGDIFAGFTIDIDDNSAGAAAAKNSEVIARGIIELAVSGAVATDVGQPIYATDDNTFTFNPVGASFIGCVVRFVSSGVVEVAFDAGVLQDPYGDGVKETLSANKTLDIEDTGKTFFVDTDATTTTLPATAVAIACRIVNIGAFGTVAVNVSPAAADKVQGPNIAGTDNKDLINTKATAQRGDFVDLRLGHADGPMVEALRGTWTTEA